MSAQDPSPVGELCCVLCSALRMLYMLVIKVRTYQSCMHTCTTYKGTRMPEVHLHTVHHHASCLHAALASHPQRVSKMTLSAMMLSVLRTSNPSGSVCCMSFVSEAVITYVATKRLVDGVMMVRTGANFLVKQTESL